MHRIFNQLGADAYSVFKRVIVRLIREKGKGHKDNLLSFDFRITCKAKIVLVRILCCNPTERDIDDVYYGIVPKLDGILLPFFESNQPLAELVFQKDAKSLQMLYGIRRDGFSVKPVNPTCMLMEERGS